MKKISKLIIALLLLIIVVPAKGQKAEESVYSSGAAVISGILEKVTINDNGDKEVWGFTKNEFGDPFGVAFVFEDVDDDYYSTSDDIQDYFIFAKEGDVIEVEGIFDQDDSDQFISVFPTRISCYGKEFNGTLNICPNPTSTIPALPGLVYSFKKDGDNQDFIIADNHGFFYFDEGDDSFELFGHTYNLGETANVRGVLSQRWDLKGKVYADVWVRESAPLKIESVEADDVLRLERDNGQITVHSTLGVNKISVYDLNGRTIFQNRYNSAVNSVSFGLSTKQSVVVSVNTENGKHFSKVVLI